MNFEPSVTGDYFLSTGPGNIDDSILTAIDNGTTIQVQSNNGLSVNIAKTGTALVNSMSFPGSSERLSTSSKPYLQLENKTRTVVTGGIYESFPSGMNIAVDNPQVFTAAQQVKFE